MAKPYREVEIKYPIQNPEEIKARLAELGAKSLSTNELQEDTYYVPAHRDFLEPRIVSEWLRIRRTGTKCSINYKLWLPVGAEIATHCDEYESQVNDPEAVEKIFAALDMREIARVHKVRSTWQIDDIEIALDTVKGLGTFIELEAKSDSEDIEKIHTHLQDALQKLAAKTLPQDHRGYPYQLLKRDR